MPQAETQPHGRLSGQWGVLAPLHPALQMIPLQRNAFVHGKPGLRDQCRGIHYFGAQLTICNLGIDIQVVAGHSERLGKEDSFVSRVERHKAITPQSGQVQGAAVIEKIVVIDRGIKTRE